jgi:molybdopterin adenylyltransferase
MRIGILTVSDRSSRGERPDTSGPALVAALSDCQLPVEKTTIVPDDPAQIRDVLITWTDLDHLDLILTTGGTGFAPRDITPEATLAVVERLAPGLSEVMRAESLKKTPHAMLSRGVAGIRHRTLIINLPGSPKAAIENLLCILPVLQHAIDLLSESPSAESGHTPISH